MSTSTMSTSNFSFVIDIHDFEDVEIKNQPYDYSSPVKPDLRPPFMEPKPVSPKRRRPILKQRETQTDTHIVSILGKRKLSEEGGDDERYGQHIGSDFFVINVGHNVVQEHDWEAEIQSEGRRERDSESKYDPEEILKWCQFYLANRNMFNV